MDRLSLSNKSANTRALEELAKSVGNYLPTAAQGLCPVDTGLIESTASVIADSADCAIGYVAGEMALTSVRAFREDYESHIARNWCCAR